MRATVVLVVALAVLVGLASAAFPTFPPTTTTAKPTFFPPFTTTTKTPSTTTTTTPSTTSTSSPTTSTTPSAGGGVDVTTYNNLILFAKYASSAYADVGSSSCSTVMGSTVIQSINIASTDTQGYVARSDSLRAFVVGFRGSTSSTDWSTDGDGTPTSWSFCSGCQIHHGFLTAWNSARPTVVSALSSQVNSTAYQGYRLVVVGHSLGGALTYLAAPDLQKAFGLITYAYSYGAPAVGNAAFASYVDNTFGAANMYRSTHTNDGVPNSTGGFFKHSMTEYWQKADPVSLDNMVKCTGDQDPNCNAGQGGSGVNAAHNKYMGLSIGTCYK